MTDTARREPPVQADGKPLIVTIAAQPHHPFTRFGLPDDALDAMRGQSVPLLANGDHSSTVGRATIQRAAVDDGNLVLTVTVEARPDAPAGYLDALRADTSWGIVPRATLADATNGTCGSVRVGAFWPGPGLPPAEPAPFTNDPLAPVIAARATEVREARAARERAALMAEPAPLGERAILLDDTEGQAMAETRALLTRHGCTAPEPAPSVDVLWAVLNDATPATRAWLLESWTGPARCFIENHDGRLATYTSLTADAGRLRDEADRLRTELDTLGEEYDGILTRQGDLLTRTVNALKGDPPPLTTWSHHDVPELAAAVVAERDAATAARDRVEALLAGKDPHTLLSVRRVRAALDGTTAPSPEETRRG